MLSPGLVHPTELRQQSRQPAWVASAHTPWPKSHWNLGGQLHLIRGWTNKSEFNEYPSDTTMYFESTALLATARPKNEWFDWLQLKAGLVNADFKTLAMEGSGTGLALGAGIVMGGDTFRLRLLDIEEYWVGGHRFMTFSINPGLLFGGGGHLDM